MDAPDIREPLGWRFFGSLAALVVLAAWVVPRLGIDGSTVLAHWVGAVILLALGATSLWNGQVTATHPARLVGAIWVAAGTLALAVGLGVEAIGPQTSWVVFLAGALAGIALELVLQRGDADRPPRPPEGPTT